MHPHQKMDDKQLSQKEMLAEKREPIGHKRTKPKRKDKTIKFLLCKVPKIWFPKDGVESICDVHLEHHQIIMDV
jgi:hypothetical protein